MDQVQEWLSAGGNGREKKGNGSEGGEDAGEEENEIVKGLVERIAKTRGGSGENKTGKTASYLDEELDLPGLDVPEREE